MLPTFALVGKVNAGKSSVLATLLEVDDEQVLRISNTPGETTLCQEYPVKFDGKEWIRFVDTPGFSRSIAAMRAIRALESDGREPNYETLKRFVEKYRGTEDFEDECRLLGPMLDGAGLLYVIDPSKPVRDAFVAEMEILRWTGQPRMALLNQKGEEGEYMEVWRKKLGAYFNLVRTFNAHTARYEERVRLMRSLVEIDEARSSQIDVVISYLDLEWEQRREDAAEAMIHFLEKALCHRETCAVTERELQYEGKRERQMQELSKAYFKSIKMLEKKMHQSLLKLYRHHLVTIQQSSDSYEEMDLFSEETWKKWGLNRTQLTLAGAATGGAGGLMIDIGTGGLTHGFGALIGAVGGAATTFFKGSELPDFDFSLGGGLKVEKGDGSALSVGPPKNDNFAWILLDSSLNYYAQILQHTHAIREQKTLVSTGESRTRAFSSSQRKVFAKWFAACQKRTSESGLESEVIQEMLKLLRRLSEERE